MNWFSIPSVSDTLERPFWSIMIPTYNPNLDYLKKTINSVVKQDLDPKKIQIEIVDDNSRNFNPAEFLSSIGAKSVNVFRQQHHVGIARSWNECIRRARGHWIHILHQDDFVLPGFYRRLRNGIEHSPIIGAAFTQTYFCEEVEKKRLLTRLKMKEAGILANWLEYVFVDLSIQTASIVVNRRVYEKLGGFNPHYQYSLDWDMWKRIASSYPIWHEPDPLACYRLHANSTTEKLAETGSTFAEIHQSIEYSKQYLPKAIAPAIVDKAKKNYAMYAVEKGWQLLLLKRSLSQGFSQFRDAKKLGGNSGILTATVKIAFRSLLRKTFILETQNLAAANKARL